MTKNELARKMVTTFGFNFKNRSYIRGINESYRFVDQTPISIDLLTEHLNGECTVSLQRYEHSKIYCIDIDNKSGLPLETITNRIKQIVNLIGQPFFVEKSTQSSGGYHLYFLFEDYVSIAWRELPKWVEKNLKFKVECIIDKDYLKLPFSKYYLVHGGYNELEDNLVDSFRLKGCLKLFEKAIPLVVNQFLVDLKEQRSNQLDIFPKLTMDTVEEFEPNFKDLSYGEGERNLNQYKIAVRTYYWKGENAFEEFVNECHDLNHGSKDMQKWKSEQIATDFERKWKAAMRFVNSHSGCRKEYEKRIDKNEVIVDLEYQNVIGMKEEKELSSFLSSKYEGRKGKAEDRFIANCVKLYKFLLNFKQYRDKRGIQYEGEFEFLNKGIPFYYEMRQKLSKQLGIKNIAAVYAYLLKHKVFTEVTDERGYTYSYKKLHWAKHFIITKISDLIKKVAEVIEVVKKVTRILVDEVLDFSLFKNDYENKKLYNLQT